jgi:hypothetical protein
MIKKLVPLFVICCLLLMTLAATAATNVFIGTQIIPTLDAASCNDFMLGPTQADPFYVPRVIDKIIIHHSGSFPYGQYDDAAMVIGYKNYHMYTVHPGVYSDESSWLSTSGLPAQQDFPDGRTSPAGYNYNSIDYHWLVGTDGVVYEGRKEDSVGWGASNWEANLSGLQICFVGCFSTETPGPVQYKAAVSLVAAKMVEFKTSDIFRHSDFTPKDCPGYSFPWEQFKKDCLIAAGIYTDVTFAHWGQPYTEKVGKLGIITGYPDGSFKPDACITKQEFVNILYHVDDPDAPRVVGPLWANDAITWSRHRDIVYINDKWDQPITRAEVCWSLAAYYQILPAPALFSDVYGSWASDAISGCALLGLIVGYPDGTFKPNNPISRIEICAIISRMDVTVLER